MNRIKGCTKIIYFYLDQIEKNIKNIEKYYASFFMVEDIFVNDGSGKTKLNKYLFGKQNNLITNDILMMNSMLDEALETIRKSINELLLVYPNFGEEYIKNFFFEDVRLLENVKGIKDNDHKVLSKFLSLKNRLYNYKYYVDMLDTKTLNNLINTLSVEDSVNNVILFEIIDSFGLQLSRLKTVLSQFENIEISQEKVNDFGFLIPCLELHKRKVFSFVHRKIRHKIFLSYEIDDKIKKSRTLMIPYLENMIYSLVKQSCLDLVKRELQGVKFHKNINISIKSIKRKIYIIVKNNGVERNNTVQLFNQEEENRYILDTLNLANIMNMQLDIRSIEQEGMEYTLIL